MKIGIMGGTFNPIHKGHILLAECAMEQYSFDEIWFMPSGHPAHKPDDELISAVHRVAMVQLAIADKKNFTLSTLEIDRGGDTYTADTLMELKQCYPKEEFYFLIGGDSLMKFHKWFRPDVIAAHATLVAAGREGYTREELERQAEYLKDTYAAKVLFLNMPELPVSSAQIRTDIRTGNPGNRVQYLPKTVWQYICEHRLYSDSEVMS